MNRTATLVTPIGLGDCILISGAAVVLSEQYDVLRVPAYKMFYESVRSFYTNYPGIEVFQVENPPGSTWGAPPVSKFEIIGEALMCGFYKASGDEWSRSLPEWIYAQLGIEYHHRWDSCPIAAARLEVKQKLVSPDCFVHDDAPRGFSITQNVAGTAYRPYFGQSSVLEHAFAIEHAAEIHCIDSSLYHLVECLDTPADLYLHLYPRPRVNNWFDYPERKNWSVLL